MGSGWSDFLVMVIKKKITSLLILFFPIFQTPVFQALIIAIFHINVEID